MLASSKKGFPYPFGLVKRRIYLDTHLKEKLTDFFKTTRVYPIHTGRVERGWWTLCLWLTLPLYVRDCLENKSMLFTHFYLMRRKKYKIWFVSLASRECFVIKPTTFLSTFWQKKYLLVMWNVRCSYKNSCWAGVQFQCPCANDL